MKINLRGLQPMTMHRIQMVRGEKKNTAWKDGKCCRTVCVCVCGILPEVAVCVVVLGGVQVLG